MTYRFESRSGIAVERHVETLDYAAGIGDLVDRLDAERGCFLSSGVEDPDRYSRWDIALVDPPLELIGRGRRLEANALNAAGVRLLAILEPALVADPAVSVVERGERRLLLEVAASEEPFAEEERSRQPTVMTPLRTLVDDFAGLDDPFLGLFGAFGYDLIFQFEAMRLGQKRDAADKLLHLFLPDAIWLVDRRKEVAYRHEFTYARAGLSTRGADRTPYRPLPQPPARASAGNRTPTSDHTDAEYMGKVEVARERIRVGDIFEVVLSRTFSAPYDGPPSSLYRLMRKNNPSPYEFLIQLGEEQLVGASPEMFVRVEGDRVESCPISGTARRGDNPMEDADRLRALYNSEKDEVELTMCTDVDRNDKARICRPGTVKLLGRRMIERYAGLFHTVDHVEGRLREGFRGLDAFLSHMWAVTLTGAPKRMAVSIVEHNEVSARRWYGGAVGALLLNGNVNTGITIRTAHLHGGRADYRAGATLVWDSVPAEEEKETRIKATSFFRALADLDAPPRPVAAAAEAPPPFPGVRIVMVDNEDSFVHTLADYFRQTGAEVKTFRHDAGLERLLKERPHLVVHSPGPGRPEEFGVPALIRALAERNVAQFGVCLGLQGMVEAFGGELRLLRQPRHGKMWEIRHDGTGLFEGVPQPARVGAYHSLVAAKNRLPAELEQIAENETGLVMAVRHRTLPAMAVQFHPESILSMHDLAGHRIVRNVVRLLAVGRSKLSAAE